MILTGPEIERARVRGDLVIEPFDRARLNPNSYNFRLGPRVVRLGGGEAGSSSLEVVPPEGYVLHPRVVYLGHTQETLGSRRYAMTLLGRSSTGRLGLFLTLAADLGHVGSASQWTLELTVVQPLRVYGGMEVGQIAFWEAHGSRLSYDGRYHADEGPVPSRDEHLNVGYLAHVPLTEPLVP